jgi:hypothetical protein
MFPTPFALLSSWQKYTISGVSTWNVHTSAQLDYQFMQNQLNSWLPPLQEILWVKKHYQVEMRSIFQVPTVETNQTLRNHWSESPSKIVYKFGVTLLHKAAMLILQPTCFQTETTGTLAPWSVRLLRTSWPMLSSQNLPNHVHVWAQLYTQKNLSCWRGMGMTVHPPLSQLMYVHRACISAKEPSDTLPGLGLALHSFWWQTCWHIIINRFYWRAHAGASHWLKELLYFWSTASETMGPKAVAWILHRPVKPGIRLSFRAHEF